MNIQIFGTKKCNDTKKAERFFKERGIKYQFVDMKEKGMSKGEYNNDPAISINPIDGVSFVINSFLRNDTTRKINGVRLQARKNGTWLVSTKLSVTGTILGQ